MEHNIPEVLNLQMEGVLFWYFSTAWLLYFIMFMCRGDQQKYL